VAQGATRAAPCAAPTVSSRESPGLAALGKLANKKTVRTSSRRSFCYCLAACCTGSVFPHASASPSRVASYLLTFPDCAILMFLQGSSARCDNFAFIAHRLCKLIYADGRDSRSTPKDIDCACGGMSRECAQAGNWVLVWIYQALELLRGLKNGEKGASCILFRAFCDRSAVCLERPLDIKVGILGAR